MQISVRFNHPVAFEETFGLIVTDGSALRVLPITIRGKGIGGKAVGNGS
jgi:hypothetical protein